MNKRDDEKLVDKHNEAIQVMPVLFNQHGYTTTVIDPTYANYKWHPDISLFERHEGINAYVSEGIFNDPEPIKAMVSNNHRNFFLFSLMKASPTLLQPLLYDGGVYNHLQMQSTDKPIYTVQTVPEGSSTVATGYSQSYIKGYNSLKNLSTITKITDGDTNTFMYMISSTTHEPMLLQEPDYVPQEHVDNTKFDAENEDRFTVNGITLSMNSAWQKKHYQINMAAMLLVGDWLDYLREEGVYDNTRIIIVSDHGRDLWHTDKLKYHGEDLSYYYPLLMVKDFNATEFTSSDEFMTNADVPTLATDGLIENPINPYTGKEINSDEKYAHDQYITRSTLWDVTQNNGYTFKESKWAKVSENLWDKENWEFYNEDTVLKEYAFPES